MYLARLTTSRLQSPPSAPRKCIELFWLSDNSWAGPPGILPSGYTIIKLRRAIYSTLIKFSVISDIALITPLALNHVYPQHQIEVHIPLSFILHTPSPKKLGAIHPFGQWAVGSAVRATNQPILTLCSAMVFTPAETARASQSNDVFLAGDVQKLNVTLLDMRIQGGCQLAQAHSKNADIDALQPVGSNNLGLVFEILPSVNVAGIGLNISLCMAERKLDFQSGRNVTT
ncbi:hypothetical protein M422DRAFT_239036 [Sphaerobolus stellatus SS14]|nr:hypothetical protein M422DRAFT_239036 [Sphaerobolus stellatus SS14]